MLLDEWGMGSMEKGNLSLSSKSFAKNILPHGYI